MTKGIGVEIRANDRASTTINHISRRLGVFNKQGLAMGIAFAGITMGIQAAMGALQSLKQYINESTQSFYAFEKSMAEAATMLDTMEKDLIPGMSEEITGLSIAFGQSAIDLSRGLYQALSAGVDAGKAMKFMKSATELASAGLASVETTVDALTTVLNAYGMSVENVNYVSDIMMKTVELGKLRLEDLAGTLGYVAPVAAQAGVAFTEITAAMATLTKQGINAHMAARSLRQTIVNLISPSAEAKEAMMGLSLAYDDLTLEARGLAGTLELINDASQGQVGILNQLIPNVRALSAVMGLTGAQSDMFAEGLREIEDAAGTTAEKLKDVTATKEYESRVTQELLNAQSRSLGETTSDWDLFFKKQEAMFKGGAAAGALLGPAGIAISMFKGGEVEQNMAKEMAKSFGMLKAEMEHGFIDEFAASLNRLESEGQSQAILYERLTSRIAEYKLDVEDLNNQLSKVQATHDYTEALRYIPMALEEASYTNNIFEESTRALVDSIRIQKTEIQDLNEANRQYSIETRTNSIETLKIQLNASGRRGRLNRTQRQRLEELRKEDLKNRIATMENQQKIDQIKDGGLTAEEKRLAIIKRRYAEEIYLINDNYNTQVHSLQRAIGYKNLLIEEHVMDQQTALNNSNLAWTTYYDTLLDETKEWSEDMKAYFKEVQGYTIGTGLSTAQNAIGSLPITKKENPHIPSWKWLEGGTPYVPSTGMYMLHRGEAVVPKNQNTGKNININVSPITVSAEIKSDTNINHFVSKLEQAVASGLVSGVTTIARVV